MFSLQKKKKTSILRDLANEIWISTGLKVLPRHFEESVHRLNGQFVQPSCKKVTDLYNL